MKKLFPIFLLLFLFTAVKAHAETNEEDIHLIPGAKSGILIEQTSGKILYQKDIDKKRSPASMTKIMTLLLIYEAMEENHFSKDTILTTSEYASSMGGSQVYLKVGEKISVDEALKCICIASANDCAVLLAEEVSGTEEQFVKKMNQRAKALGCKNTNFTDCTGLSNENHYTTAYDLALISKELLTKFPEVTEYTTLKEDYIRKDTPSPFWLVNTNKMIGRVEGLLGLKTGYTSFSGYCITLCMKRQQMNLISVVFGYDKATTRNAESLELLNYGYKTYKLDRILCKGDTIKSIQHILYKKQIDVVVKEDLYYLCRKDLNPSYKICFDYDLATNQGKVEAYIENTLICDTDAIPKEQPEKRNFFEISFQIIKNIFLST